MTQDHENFAETAGTSGDAADGANGLFDLPEELLMLRDMVRRFMDNEVRPAEEAVEHDAIHLPIDVRDRLQEKAKALGLWCYRSPSEYGGAGLGLLAQAVVAEEISRCRMGCYVQGCEALGWDPPNALFLGSKYQIEKYGIPGIEKGEKVFVAVSEPSGGSDPARAIRTRAERQGDSYVLNGSKTWISGAGDAEWGLVFARTGAPGERGGISCFIVDADTPGFSKRVIPVIRSFAPYELFFDDVKVPVENRLGEEGHGFQVAEKWLIEGRIPYAAGTIGTAQLALEMAIAYAKERHTFGSALADKQAIQWMIADSEMELRAARLLTYQAASLLDQGKPAKVEASIAKVVSTETANRVIDRCMQIHGGMGVAEELPFERWFRELRIKRIGEGPSEVHRMVLARSLLKERR